MTITNHYGTLVSSDKPITGVLQTTPQFFPEELDNAIDLACNVCNHRNENACARCDTSDHIILVGSWRLDTDNKYTPDHGGEYAAIYHDGDIQVVWSQFLRNCALCSPVFIGQGDLATPGDFLCYDLPPGVYGVNAQD